MTTLLLRHHLHRLLRAAYVLAALLLAADVSAQTVFINEIHYDNVGTDANEGIEVAGPAGTNLNGWSLVLYNGDASSLRVYGSVPLSGVISDQQNGFGTLAFFLPANGLQNGAPDGLVLVNGSGQVVQFLSYEGSFTAADGPAAGLASVDIGVAETSLTPVGFSLQLAGNGTRYADFTWADAAANSFGVPNAGQRFSGVSVTAGACGAAATRIHSVQGSGAMSPLRGATNVVIEAVVIAVFVDPIRGLSGFFLQEEAADQDADPNTSEGIFVFTGSTPSPAVLNLQRGDVVRVLGSVSEFGTGTGSETQLSAATPPVKCGSSTVTPVTLSLPLAAATDWERYEGMLVTLAGPLVVTDNFNLGGFGEVVLAPRRLQQPTHVAAPGVAAQAVQALNDRSRIVLDDGSTLARQNLEPTLYPNGGLSAANTLRVGDTLTGTLTGVLHQRFGSYRIQPVDRAAFGFAPTNARTSTPAAVAGTLKLASFNVLNYFTTLDTGAAVCGPDGGQNCRGANSAEEFSRQRRKTLAALAAINADVVGLIELENNAEGSLRDLVEGLNALLGSGTYRYINTGTIRTDAIKVGLIYKAASVTPAGPFAVLDASVDPRAQTTLNRPTLAQTFRSNATGQLITVAINHFKSKGSPCNDVNDPDTGDGQGNCNLTRTRMAQALVDWLATDPTRSGDARVLILGDLNAYAKEDPITALTRAGYVNLIDRQLGTGAYSYVFQGQSGYLDHALASPALAPLVSGVTEWHINADEPVALDYNLEWTSTLLKSVTQAANYDAPTPFRSSDHDPVIVGVNLVCGDLNDDNAVNDADRLIFRATLGRCVGQGGFNRRADYDGDGCITLTDYQRWYSCSRGVALPSAQR